MASNLRKTVGHVPRVIWDTEMAGAVLAVRDVVDEREGEESEERRGLADKSGCGWDGVSRLVSILG